MFKSKNLLRVLSLLLMLVFITGILTGCTSFIDEFIHSGDDDYRLPVSDEELFDELMEELFREWVSGDALSMNYYLADPEARGFERPENTFGKTATPEVIEESKQETIELIEQLNGFTYDNLRYDQQIVYDILRRNISLSEAIEREDDYNYYTGYIRPLIGFQVQLPVLLAEFSFYTADDIERYLGLISDTIRYFDEMIEFERERSKRGFFLSDANVDSICEQIESFIADRDDNLLISVFNDKIDTYDGLTQEQRDSFKERNKDLVLNNVLVAYDNLLAAMKELKGHGVHDGGLASLPGGVDYAYARLRFRTGTDKTPNEIDDLYVEYMDNSLNVIMESLYGNPVIFEKFVNETQGQIHDGTPKSYISELQRHIGDDFPPIRSTGLTVLDVHESLQEHMSPAFYLTPAIDRYNDNVVYINPAKINDNLFLFTVLAHESYPGHMYQTVYFLQQSPHPVRVALSNSGYTEGWATYAEMISYFFALDDFEEAALMWELRFFDILLQGRIDLGVNLLGWSFDEVVGLLERFGIENQEVAKNLYDMVTGIPLNSIMYSLGFIELVELIEYISDLQGNDFDLLEFHRYFLNFGPAPFSMIRKHMTDDIQSSQTNSLKPAA